jgi:multimeric flavodoxin WrbA
LKVIAFNGSARKNGNTAAMINHVFAELSAEGIETEMVQFAGKSVRGCVACYKCKEAQNQTCHFEDDVINDCISKMIDADGIILASPTYFADLTTEMKALVDRAGMVARMNGHSLKRKVGASIVVARRGGSIHAFDSLNHFFLISNMIVPGSSYWNIAFGRDIGDVESDEEGIRTMKDLGQNMAWLMKKINA